ncbi:unnamed protein product [Ambrosiozyma monospora]|uniref:Unnamed protein product n=1 Tax=Ambrosiozyma monospora TaxID=43982 RepID=A0A9W6Z0B6_AMBMO|nr:unnamed protein product [Ambrosiozyma monospora]
MILNNNNSNGYHQLIIEVKVNTDYFNQDHTSSKTESPPALGAYAHQQTSSTAESLQYTATPLPEDNVVLTDEATTASDSTAIEVEPTKEAEKTSSNHNDNNNNDSKSPEKEASESSSEQPGSKNKNKNKSKSKPTVFDSLVYDYSNILNTDISKGDANFHKFFATFVDLYEKNKQTIPNPDRPLDENGKTMKRNGRMIGDPDLILSEYQLLKMLTCPEDFMESLTEKHAEMVSQIPSSLPFPFYHGSGYVFVGGGIFTWYVLLNIQMLRQIGATLPIEVIIPSRNEYEVEPCEQILPKFNAKCVLMPDVFGDDAMSKLKVAGFQYKALALLASSFDTTFLIDADSFASFNPEELIESQIFKDFGMITWPDYWRRTTSPKYYEVAGIQVGDVEVRHLNDKFTPNRLASSKTGNGGGNDGDGDGQVDVFKDINFHDRAGTIPDWSTESGEFLVRKSTHFDVLLLALYYNLDGPQGYYPLLSQVGPGEGDKETFVAAATCLKKNYYQVARPCHSIGRFQKPAGNWDQTTIIQSDPITDLKRIVDVIKFERDRIDEMGRAEKEAKYKAEEEAKAKEKEKEKEKEADHELAKSKPESAEAKEKEKDTTASLMKRDEPDEIKYEGNAKYTYKTHFREELTKDKLVR